MPRLAALALLVALAVAAIGYVAIDRLLESARAPRADPAAASSEGAARAPIERAPAGGSVEPAARPADGGGPDDALAWNEEGVARLEAGELDEAIALFERSVEARPEVADFRHNLAEALARSARATERAGGDLARSLAFVERAVELAPDRADLAALAERWRREHEVEEEFWADRSVHFQLRYDSTREGFLYGAQDVLDLLEAAYADLSLRFGVEPVGPGDPPLRVSLYDRDEFGAVTGLGDWAGGVFDGSVRVPVEDLSRERDRLQRVLRHELAHHFVHEVSGGRAPGWLNEGVAQLLEEHAPDQRARAVEAARARLGDAPLFPLERISGSLASWKDAGEIARAYAQSLLLVDYVERQYGRWVLQGLVAGCGEGLSVEESFEELTSVPIETLLDDVRAGL